MKKRKQIGLARKKDRVGYIFILPVMIGALFIFLPAVLNSLIYAFNNVTIEFNGIKTSYIGWRNFKDAFMVDPEFRVIILSAAKGIIVDSGVIILFSFFISNVLNQKFLGRGISRMIFFMPVILSVGIVAKIEGANSIYNIIEIGASSNSEGEFNQIGMKAMFNMMGILNNLGVTGSVGVIVMNIIRNMQNIVNSSGVQIMIFLSSLQSINPAVFEASKMEGATKWEEFWKITFPLLTPNLLVCIVYTIIDTFTNPVYGVMDYIQSQAFNNGKMGYAAALSWIYFALVLVVLGVSVGLISRRVTYLE